MASISNLLSDGHTKSESLFSIVEIKKQKHSCYQIPPHCCSLQYIASAEVCER